MRQAVNVFYFKCILWCGLLLLSICSNSQNYFGISANAGNWLKYSPNSSYLKRPVSFSGSLTYLGQIRTSTQSSIQFRGETGVIGFNIKTLAKDTISTPAAYSYDSFVEYIIFYTNAGIFFTKIFSIGGKQFFYGLGGGATYYYIPFPTVGYEIEISDKDNTGWKIFDSYIERSKKEIFGFASAQIGVTLTKHLLLSLSYNHHFSPIYAGTYEFYHTKNPSKGNLSLYQREIKLGILFKLSKKSREQKN